jgi:hypothetical protein
MKKAVLAIALVVAVGATWFAATRRGVPSEPPATPGVADASPTVRPKASNAGSNGAASLTPAAPAKPAGALSPDEKAARIAKIATDYEDIMAKAAADFSALGAAFPGGFNAYLRQLALLEREKWKDYAEFLTPRELEDLQFRQHHAGKTVTQFLADTAATDEQRRAVLRLQRDFDDKYSLIFDLTPASLAARETERQALQEQILAVLGPNLFAAWLRGEGEDFGNLTKFAQTQGLRAEAPLEVWRIRNEFTRRRLEISAQLGPTLEAKKQQVALVDQTRTRVAAIVGVEALRSPASSGLTWLAPK